MLCKGKESAFLLIRDRARDCSDKIDSLILSEVSREEALAVVNPEKAVVGLDVTCFSLRCLPISLINSLACGLKETQTGHKNSSS